MMKGYLLKINGMVIPEQMIVTKCHIVPDVRRQQDKYYNANGLEIIEYSDHTQTEITLTLSEIWQEETELLKKMIPDRNEIEIEYWNPIKNDYAEGRFWLEKDIVFKTIFCDGFHVKFEEITMEFKEY